MLSAGRAHQQVRHVWAAVPWAGQAGCSCKESLCTSSPISDAREESASCRSEYSSETVPHAFPREGGELRTESTIDCRASSSACSSSFSTETSVGQCRTPWYSGITSILRSPAAAVSSSSLPGGAVGLAVAPLFISRAYHPWYYGSKLRNRTILSTMSLDELESMLRHEGTNLDHINLAAFLQQLQRAAAAEATAAAAGSSSSAATADPAATGAAGASSTSGTQAVVAAAATRAVERRATQIAAQAAQLVRRRAKWYDPRYAALVVSRTAALGHTDGLLLHDMTARVVERLNEAYSRDLLLLLRGLYAHTQNSASYTSNAEEQQQQQESNRRGRRAAPPLPYSGPPDALVEGVRAFLLGKVPTGRMPPENLDGLLRYLRALSGRPVGQELCAAATEDLNRRLPIYAPAPLAGVLSTLAAERYPLPAPLLSAAAEHFAANVEPYGNGAAAARFLTASATLLRLPAAEGAQEGGEEVVSEWLGARMGLLTACLQVMARDLPDTPPEKLASWMQALAKVKAPLAALSSSSSSGDAAAAAAAAFVRGHAAAVQRALPSTPALAPSAAAASGATTATSSGASPSASAVVTRLRSAYDAVGLPYPKGL